MHKFPKLAITCVMLAAIHFISCIILICFYTNHETTQIPAEASPVELMQVSATIDGVTTPITLPHTFTNLAPRTKVTLSANFLVPEGGYFYLRAEHAPVQIYKNDTLIYEYGQDGTFPFILQDPVLDSDFVAIGAPTQEAISFRMEYQSPITQSQFTVSPIRFGTQDALYSSLFSEFNFQFMFSIALILTCIFVILVSLIITTFERRAFFITLLGISDMCAGIWLLCECPLLTLSIEAPVAMYICGLYAMAVFSIPLIWFSLSVLELHHSRPLIILSLVQLSLVLGSIYLQPMFLVSPLYIEEVFNIIVPLFVSLFAIDLLVEHIVFHNKSVRNFTVPALAFALFTILDFINNRFQFTSIGVSFFQIGTMVLMFSLCVLAGVFMKDALTLREESKQAEFKNSMVEYQAELLKSHHSLMIDTADKLRKQRHDLRHQLAVIRELSQDGDQTELQNYLDSVLENIPSEQIYYCENAIINAILSHYTAICAKYEISFSVDLMLPNDFQRIPDTDFCIIFSNLLENAVEACQYLPRAKRFINLSSRMRYNTLMITLENSFDGNYSVHHGKFRSRKRDADGIGLSSIQSVAAKYGGDATFQGDDTLFRSMIYMQT